MLKNIKFMAPTYVRKPTAIRYKLKRYVDKLEDVDRDLSVGPSNRVKLENMINWSVIVGNKESATVSQITEIKKVVDYSVLREVSIKIIPLA